MLFIWLRPALNVDPILLDLANFVAHSDGRNQGVSFEYIRSSVESFIVFAEGQGDWNLAPPFNKDTVLQNLTNSLQDLGIIFDKEKLLAQTDRIRDGLLELMEETEFKFLNNPKIIRCYLKREGDQMKFHLDLNHQGKYIRMNGGGLESSLFN